MKFVIEHLDEKLYPWSLLEYKHLSSTIGEENILFTHINNKEDKAALQTLGTIEEKSVVDLDLKKVCVLDPKATVELCPADAKEFDYFVFGGVLGNHPMDGRTEQALSKKLPQAKLRHLGDKQMSTDTAVIVTKMILDGKKLNEIAFVEDIEIQLGENYSQILPYRYLVKDGQPSLAPGLIEYLLNEE